MATANKGKATITAGQTSVTVNFESNAFTTPPAVNISPNDNINVYLHEITNSYFICKINETLSSNLEINYAAIELSK